MYRLTCDWSRYIPNRKLKKILKLKQCIDSYHQEVDTNCICIDSNLYVSIPTEQRQKDEKMKTFSRPKMYLVKAYIVDLVEFMQKMRFFMKE